jgi:hypothetical protein
MKILNMHALPSSDRETPVETVMIYTASGIAETLLSMRIMTMYKLSVIDDDYDDV